MKPQNPKPTRLLTKMLIPAMTAVSVMLCSTAMAFTTTPGDGAPNVLAKPAASPSVAQPPAAATVAAPLSGSVATSVLANTPTSAPIVVGGIAANQIAMSQKTLDAMLYQAIDASNVAGVIAALKAGAKLSQDFRYSCTKGPEASEGEFEDKRLVNGNNRAQLVYGYPGHCSRQHLLHALDAYSRAIFQNGTPSMRAKVGSSELAMFAPEKTMAIWEASTKPYAPSESEVKAYKDAQDKANAALEVLALIEANIPEADKAFYPAYLQPLLKVNQLPPLIGVWLLQRGLLKRPPEELDLYKDMGRETWERWPEVFDVNLVPRTKQQPFLYKNQDVIKAETAAFMLRNISENEGYVCGARKELEQQWSGAARQAMPAFKGYKALVDIEETFLNDDPNQYLAGGQKTKALSESEAKLHEAIGLLQEAKERSNRPLEVWQMLTRRRENAFAVNWLIKQPLFMSNLNNPANSYGEPLPNFLMVSDPMAPLSHPIKPGMARALLESGMMSNLLNEKSQSIADRLLTGSPDDKWRARALLQRDFNPNECRPGTTNVRSLNQFN